MPFFCHNLDGSKKGWAEFPKGHQETLVKASTHTWKNSNELSGAH